MYGWSLEANCDGVIVCWVCEAEAEAAGGIQGESICLYGTFLCSKQ
jgi:hypothetical protein